LKIKKSKSKPRVIVVVRYQNLIRDWLRRHVAKDDPNAPLFYTNTGKQVRGNDLYMYISRLRRRLGISDRIYLHLLRHYRATQLYGKLSEKKMMQWFGWSTRYMIDIYSRLKETAAVERFLELYGVGKREGNEANYTVECSKCGTRNLAEARYRYRCGSPITVEAAVDREREVEEAKLILDELIEIARENPELLRELLSRRARRRRSSTRTSLWSCMRIARQG